MCEYAPPWISSAAPQNGHVVNISKAETSWGEPHIKTKRIASMSHYAFNLRCLSGLIHESTFNHILYIAVKAVLITAHSGLGGISSIHNSPQKNGLIDSSYVTQHLNCYHVVGKTQSKHDVRFNMKVSGAELTCVSFSSSLQQRVILQLTARLQAPF